MGVDLRLLPIEHDTADWGFSHTVLDTDRDYDWHAELNALLKDTPPLLPPTDFTCWTAFHHTATCEEGGYGKKAEDAYGQPLRCLRAGDFRTQHPLSARNRAVLAYLAALPADTKIALDWH